MIPARTPDSAPAPRPVDGMAALATIVLISIVAVAVLGPERGLVVAGVLAGIVAVAGLEQASRVAGVAALVALIGTAGATVLERAVTDTWNLRFASDRPVANELGALTGVTLIACSTFGLASVRRRPAASDVVHRARASGRDVAHRIPAGVYTVVAGVLAGGVLAFSRAALGPAGGDAVVRRAVTNLVLGMPFQEGIGAPSVPSALVPGLAVVTGIGPPSQGLIAAALVGVCGVFLLRRTSAPAFVVGPIGVGVAALAAVAPSPSVVTLAFVAAAAAVLVSAPSASASYVVGGLLAVAVLGDPIVALGGMLVGWVAAKRNGWISAGAFLGSLSAGFLLSAAIARSVGADLSGWILGTTDALLGCAILGASALALLALAIWGAQPKKVRASPAGVRRPRGRPR